MTSVNPEMIRVARLSRGKHQTEVAAALGIKQPTYSKIENGAVGISDPQIEKLCEVLGYPHAFFFQSDRIWGTASPHHRRRKSVSAERLQELEMKMNVLRMGIRRLLRNVSIDAPFSMPTLPVDEIGSPEEAAREVRRLWRLPTGPIQSVVRALEDAGALVLEIPFESRVDAISVWGPGEQPLIVLNSSYAEDRKRHTASHEGGHLILHATEASTDPETEADAFAAEFLMPSNEIRSELRGLKLDDLADLKRRWRVSMRSLVFRASTLGELSKDQARYMFMRLNQLYGAKNEPVQLPAERPALLDELTASHLNDLGYSIRDLAELVNWSVEETQGILGVRSRHLHLA